MQPHPALVEIARILLEFEIELQREEEAAADVTRQDAQSATASTRQAAVARSGQSTLTPPQRQVEATR